jgi:hypothetical protein
MKDAHSQDRVSNLLQPSFGERYLSSALFAGIKEEVEKQSFEA